MMKQEDRNETDPGDRILLKIRSIGCKFRPRLFIFLLESHAVPLVSQACVFPLPVLQECHRCGKWLWGIFLTPERHEDCIKDCSRMIKQVGNFCIGTNLKMDKLVLVLCDWIPDVEDMWNTLSREGTL